MCITTYSNAFDFKMVNLEQLRDLASEVNWAEELKDSNMGRGLESLLKSKVQKLYGIHIPSRGKTTL